MESRYAETLVNGLGIRIENTPPYRADWKGIVEQTFNTLDEKVKPFVPGHIDIDFHVRGGKEYRLDVKLDIIEFTRIIIQLILSHNNKHWMENYQMDEEMIEADIDPIPLKLWNWGIVNRSGLLKNYPSDIVRLNLLPAVKATVTEKGIRLKNMYYSCDKAISEEWFDRARSKGTWKEDIAYDSRNMDYIYIKAEDCRSFLKCSMIDKKKYGNKTFEEIEYLDNYEKLKKEKNTSEILQSKVDAISDIEKIVAEAEAKNNNSTGEKLSNSAKLKGIRDNRRNEKAENRKTEAFELGEKDYSTGVAKVIPLKEEICKDYKYPSHIEYLKQKQKERMEKSMNRNPNTGWTVKAEYSEQEIKEYQGNPLIEALPPIWDFRQAEELIHFYPEHEEYERKLNSHIRYHYIQRLFCYFQPLGTHLDIEQRISTVIRQGYLSRNPMAANYAKDMQTIYKMIKAGDYSFKSAELSRPSAAGFTIIGFSGMGKTTAVEKIIEKYPQLIVHDKYKENELDHYQLVWLKLDCPHDGSVKGLCSNFFIEFDRLLGDNTYNKYAAGRNTTTDTMIPQMAQIARRHSLGLLIIDKIQHLSIMKSGGREKMLNFFVSLVNKIGIPVVLIGTTKAMPVLQGEFRQARRGSGHQGDVIWENMKRCDDWDLLVEGMWEYQWTVNKVPLTDEIKVTLYDESQGIIDITVKLYAMTQMRAIATGEENITPALIRKVADDSLQLVKPMVKALKSGDKNAIKNYGDITPININEYCDEQLKTLNLNERINEKKSNINKSNDIKNSIFEDVVLKLVEYGINPEKAKKFVKSAIQETNETLSLEQTVLAAMKLSFMEELQNESKPKNRKASKKALTRDSDDLRTIVENGRKENKSAYESLKEAGVIKNPVEEFIMIG